MLLVMNTYMYNLFIKHDKKLLDKLIVYRYNTLASNQELGVDAWPMSALIPMHIKKDKDFEISYVNWLLSNYQAKAEMSLMACNIKL